MIPTKPPPRDKNAMDMTDAEFRAARERVRRDEALAPIRRAEADAAARIEAEHQARIATGRDEAGVRAKLVERGMDEADATALAAEIAARARGAGR